MIRKNITAKLILAMVMMAVAPLMIGGFLINRNTANDVLEQTGHSAQEVAARTADLVAQTLAENVRLLETLAVSSDIQFQAREVNRTYYGTEKQIVERLLILDKQWINTPPAVAAESQLMRAVNNESRNPIVRVLQGFKSRFPNHVLLYMTDRYGGNVASTGPLPDFYQGDEPWWQQVYREGTGSVYIGKPELDRNAGTIVVNLAVPVRDVNNEVVGVLASALDVKGIRELLGSVKLGRTGHMAIADAEGEILFDPIRQPEPGQKLPDALLSTEVQKKSVGGWVPATNFGDQPAIVGYSRVSRSFDFPALEQLQWTTLAMIESQEALEPVSASTRYELGLGLIVVLVAIGLAIFLASRFTLQIKHITNLFKEIRLGHYEMRAPVVTSDELGQMTSDLNQMLDETLILIQSRREREELQNSIMKLLNDVSGLAEGDLTVEAEVRSDITGAIADAFNYMTAELRQIIGKVQDVTRQVGSSASETQNTTEQLAMASEGQAQQILAARETIEQMTRSIHQVTEVANRSKNVAERSLQTAKQGAEAVRDTIRGMNGIRDQVQETAKRIKRLGEQSQEIGEIVRLIGDIAYRTSVLALNASIQAARSGEAGRGFAVVAEEVEQLSKRSTEASKRIGVLVKVIQAGTNEAIAAMEESTQEVVEGSRLADQAGHALIEIEKVSVQLAELVDSISLATERQAQGSQTVSRTMIKLSEVTQHTAHGIKQSAVSVNNLAALANDLRSSVASFRLLSNGQP
ncbi:MAG TPA: methyl-accepting chemotaxis protein [Blastocatellia bacterium]|nr:methyl-accepting chemotaxis protein [Blastocatellia bacterium]